MTKAPIMLHGQKVGRLRASWLLFKEAWRFFKADPELLWVPVIFGVICIFSVIVIFGTLVLFVVGYEALSAGASDDIPALWVYSFIFLIYVASAFTYALSQASVVHTVSVRIHGGNATLGESLKAAFSHAGTLFMWSLITSTVGVILYIIAERSRLLGKIVAWVLGAVWSVMTYFVVTAVVLERYNAVAAIKRSGFVFKTTWGETFVSNISLGLTFFLAHVVALLAFIGFIATAILLDVTAVYVVGFVLFILWLFVATLMHEVLHAILKTLLYIYATESVTTQDFDTELLQSMLARTNQSPSVMSSVQTTVS